MLLTFFILSSCNDKGLEVVENEDVESFILSDKAHSAENPFLTRDEKGSPVVSWVEGEDENTCFYYARWDTKEKHFGAPIKVGVTNGLATHHESMAKIVFKADGTAFVVYQVKRPSDENRFASALFYTYSNDEEHWSEPAFLHTDTREGIGRSFFDLAILPNGEVGAVWLDGRKKLRNGSTLMFASTLNNQFQEDVEIAQQTCQCCRTDLYVDEENTVHVAFRDIINDSIRDIVYLRSDDNGKTFSESICISNDNWIIDGCPHTGPSMASTSEGLHFFWFTLGGGDGVYSTSTSDKGEQFSKRQLLNSHARHPQAIALKNNNLAIVWDETFKTESTYLDRIGLMIRDKSGKDRTEYISSEKNNSDHPVLLEMSDGSILVVWAETSENKKFVRYAIIE